MYKKLILLLTVNLLVASNTGFGQKSQHYYDVIVYGATSAGVIAAVSVKKQGKSVIIIEPSSHIGGLTTGGLGQTDIGNKSAISGLSRDFYRQVGKHYGKLEQWTFEPSVAQSIFTEMLYKNNVEVLKNHELKNVGINNREIKHLELVETNNTFKIKTLSAKIFIDCSYEGDLMAMAGISYTVGREANSMYGETYNGVQMLDKHQFPDGIDPFVIVEDSTSGLLWGISKEKLAPAGSSDNKLQAYNFRLCLTDSLENKIEITKPTDYEPKNYELLLRYIEKKTPHELNWALMHLQPMPHRKLDINNSGPFSTNLIGGNYDYPNATYAERKIIQKNHENYVKGFLYFLGNDSRVPNHLRTEMKKWGYPRDEYIENGNFTPQMYVREARRMVSDKVMTEKHCIGDEVAEDGIGLAAYTMDSHNTQRLIVKNKDGKYQVKNEGDVQMGLGGLDPYPVSYRSIIPSKTECENLLVPVCLSASHIAFGSIRMEPVFMVLAQSAATAAVLAINTKKNLHEISVKQLQKILADKPFSDDRIPDILIDNLDTASFKTEGNWDLINKGYGRYGKNYVKAKANARNVATFKAILNSVGSYSAYLYIPKIEGHVSKVNATINIGEQRFEKLIFVNSEESDWYYLGSYPVTTSSNASISISSVGEGFIIADAALFIRK